MELRNGFLEASCLIARQDCKDRMLLIIIIMYSWLGGAAERFGLHPSCMYMEGGMSSCAFSERKVV